MSDLIKTLITQPFLGRFLCSWARFDGKNLQVAGAGWRGCGCGLARSNPWVTHGDHYLLADSYCLLISFGILSLCSALYYLHLHNLFSFILQLLIFRISRQLLN
jgi:hypothetical protein